MNKIYIVTAEAVVFCDDSTFDIRCVTTDYKTALKSFENERKNLQKLWKELHDDDPKETRKKGVTWHQTYRHTWSVESDKARFKVLLQDFDLNG